MIILDSNFYQNNSDDSSSPVPSISFENERQLKQTVVQARDNQQYRINNSPIASFGIPGTPYDEGTDNPAYFLQGENVVFDAFLFYGGQEVDSEEYDIKVIVKTSPRAINTTWIGEIGSGITPSEGQGTGYYDINIPSAITANLYAGTYFADLLIVSKNTETPSVHVIYNFSFEIGYGVSSPHPETMSTEDGGLKRTGLENTWPNTPSTFRGPNQTQ